MEIRSYRRVFDLERRVYSIDSLRLNPSGVPVRGILYLAAILALDVIAGRLPVIGGLAGALPWFLRYLLLPGATATVLGMLRVEGRTFHLAALALLRLALGPRRLSGLRRCAPVGGRWYPQEILILPDGSDARMRRLRYTGPGAVLIAVEHERTGVPGRGARGLARPRRRALSVSESSGGRVTGRKQVLLLGAGARMLVRAGARGEGRR